MIQYSAILYDVAQYSKVKYYIWYDMAPYDTVLYSTALSVIVIIASVC